MRIVDLEKKVDKIVGKIILVLVNLAIFISGLLLLARHDWTICLGVFLVLWAHNGADKHQEWRDEIGQDDEKK